MTLKQLKHYTYLQVKQPSGLQLFVVNVRYLFYFSRTHNANRSFSAVRFLTLRGEANLVLRLEGRPCLKRNKNKCVPLSNFNNAIVSAVAANEVTGNQERH